MTVINRVQLDSERIDDGTVLSFAALRAINGFAHAVTTRPWNMATHRGPEAELAADRRRRVCDHLGLPFDHLVALNQIHSPHVVQIRPSDRGAGRADRTSAIQFADGAVCDLPQTPVMQFSADCPLLVAVEPRRRVFGTAHASWRCTVAGIAGELLWMMGKAFDVRPESLIVCICPCAGPDEYEVQDDMFRIAQARLGDAERFFPMRDNRRCFDMRAANMAQLMAAGVRSENIHVADHSTMSDARFYSHRRDGAATGRFALIAGFR